jgi:hypothetical protein
MPSGSIPCSISDQPLSNSSDRCTSAAAEAPSGGEQIGIPNLVFVEAFGIAGSQGTSPGPASRLLVSNENLQPLIEVRPISRYPSITGTFEHLMSLVIENDGVAGPWCAACLRSAVCRGSSAAQSHPAAATERKP